MRVTDAQIAKGLQPPPLLQLPQVDRAPLPLQLPPQPLVGGLPLPSVCLCLEQACPVTSFHIHDEHA
jgi:hypothetical protein